MSVEITREIDEELGKDCFEVWDNDELIHEGYFDADQDIPDEEKYMIILANALGFEAAELLNLDVFNDERNSKDNLRIELHNIWLKDIYKNAKEDHLAMASHEHLCALGSPNNETATIHENSADIHRTFAKLMDNMIAELHEK